MSPICVVVLWAAGTVCGEITVVPTQLTSTVSSASSRASARTIGLAGLVGAATAIVAWLLAMAVMLLGLVAAMRNNGLTAAYLVWIVGGIVGVGMLWLVSRLLNRLGVAHPIGATLTSVAVTVGVFAVVTAVLPRGQQDSPVMVALPLGVAMLSFALAARCAHHARALGLLAIVAAAAFTGATLAF